MPLKKKKSALKRAHKIVLTPLVLRKRKHLNGNNSLLFDEWHRNKKVEFLPNGMPYKITDNLLVRASGGALVDGLNQPVILVSDLLSKAERRGIARHEVVEWERLSRTDKQNGEIHDAAVRRENPRLRASATDVTNWFQEIFRNSGMEVANKLTRADYLKWQKSQGKQK